MKKNKIILDNCPNYYKIKNYDYEEDDYVTSKLIGIYEDYIFNINEKNIEELKKIQDLDRIISKYINDYTFRKQVQNGLLNIKVRRGSSIIDVIVEYLLNSFESFEDGYTRNIYFARWI